MTDPASHYSDPLEEALSQGAQRIAQLASVLGAAAEVNVRRKALKDAKAAAGTDTQASKVLGEQERAAYQQARVRWAPAHDRLWLVQADLLQTARAWSAAACYADTDPLAASAMRKCEERLRTLHPYAMARYDRLLGEAMDPLAAMRETAPLFGRAPRARPAEEATARAALGTAAAGDIPAPASEQPDTLPGPDPAAGQGQQAEQGGRRIASQLQARARAAGRDALGADELMIVLETVTNLPRDVIERIAQPAAGDGGKANAAAAGRTAAQMAAENFPHSAADVVAAAAATDQAGRSQVRATAPRQVRRAGRPL